ncbi:Aminoglycoside phosphotransferase [Niveomyces insectorum RCEF 264]|uniref:Aminoglycoside phosphotransferase n=1 Tax=Niveomyces insectorum RCEF 264 TaxID=1081102 RepID=A0A167WAA5_9HYPO|nr:Aminoglycoside phosphotransferase [Niveomyces insectorum RCEF 264]
MAVTLPLIRGRISLEEALEEDSHIIQELSYPEKRLDFFSHLFMNRPHIEEVVAHHLNIARSDFRLSHYDEWIHGSFNACLPVYITAGRRTARLPHRLIIRFPLPYKVGEEVCPGNVEEKLRTEAATYVWLQRECPAVPIPRLLGFGLPRGQSFTPIANGSIFVRVAWHVRSFFAWMRGSILSPYVPYRRQSLLDVGYLLLERVDEGEMLSTSWKTHRSDPRRRRHLYRGLAQIMLSLSARPLPRIGSWTMDDQGVLTLTNRPLTHDLHYQENMGIAPVIPRHKTYTSAEQYYLDLLACQDQRLRQLPNAVHDVSDGQMQVAALAAMRALLPCFTDRRHRDGPFVLELTDLHASNIFVDDAWNITRVIDLEWACARPIDMVLTPPAWLSGHCLDEIKDHREEYDALRNEFVSLFEEEEKAVSRQGTTERTQILRAGWDSSAFWYFQALDAPSALLSVFMFSIRRLFMDYRSIAEEACDRTLGSLWDRNVDEFIADKVKEQEEYNGRVREIFAAAEAAESNEGEDKKLETSETGQVNGTNHG